MLDETFTIDTPENVSFGYNVAGIGSRFLAAIVDTTVLGLIYLGIWLFAALVLTALPKDLRSGTWLIAGIVLIAFIIFWGYYIFFELTWSGQSPGKRWVGLRVVRVDGAPVTFVEILIRNLIRAVDFLPTFYGVGLVTMFLNSQARRLGDLAAGTLVIFDRGSTTLDVVGKDIQKNALPSFVRYDTALDLHGLDTSRLTQRTVDLAESFMRRRHMFANQSTLAAQIGFLIEAELGDSLTSIEAYQPEDRIAAVLNAYHGN